jgi:hypothetical protein
MVIYYIFICCPLTLRALLCQVASISLTISCRPSSLTIAISVIAATLHFPVTLSLFALAVSRATAWGTVGHATVATIAKNFLTSEATGFVSSVLGSGTTMASVASWADTYRYTSAGAFTKPYHFIDSEDAPPSSCGVKLSRDCGTGGCIVSAIANYVRSPFHHLPPLAFSPLSSFLSRA